MHAVSHLLEEHERQLETAGPEQVIVVACGQLVALTRDGVCATTCDYTRLPN